MNGSCAVCWGDMESSAPAGQSGADREPQGSRAEAAAEAAKEDAEESGPGQSLPCGHAFHRACIRRWLKQCHTCAPPSSWRKPVHRCAQQLLWTLRARLPLGLHTALT